MDNSVKEIELMQSVGKTTDDLHQGVSTQLNQAGIKITPQEINPDDQGPLQKIQEVLQDAEYAAESMIGDESKIVRVDSSKGWIRDRAKRVIDMFKNKKAA